MTQLPDKPHLTVEEVAAWLCVRPRVVRYQIEKGALPAKKFGREFRIERSVVVRFGAFSATS